MAIPSSRWWWSAGVPWLFALACGSYVDPTPVPGTDTGAQATSTGPSTTGRADGADTSGACPVGAMGCACTPGGGCDDELICASNLCVDPEDSCPRGSETCPCTDTRGCDPGLRCLSDRCVDPTGGST